LSPNRIATASEGQSLSRYLVKQVWSKRLQLLPDAGDTLPSAAFFEFCVFKVTFETGNDGTDENPTESVFLKSY